MARNTATVSLTKSTNQLLDNITARIAQSIQSHVDNTTPILKIAIPDGHTLSESFPDNFFDLQQSFWFATSLKQLSDNEIIFQNVYGNSYTLRRINQSEAVIKIHTNGDEASVYHIDSATSPMEQIGTETVTQRRLLPLQQVNNYNTLPDTWVKTHVSNSSKKVISQRSNLIRTTQGEPLGILSSNMSMEYLNILLRSINISPHGFALVFEEDGTMVATSAGALIRPDTNGGYRQQSLRTHPNPQFREAYQAIAEQHALAPEKTGAGTITKAFSYISDNGERINAAYELVEVDPRTRWYVAVIMPDKDFLGELDSGLIQNFSLGLLGALVCLGVCLSIMHTFSRDLGKLSLAAKSIGEGKVGVDIDVYRRDDIGELADQFREMQSRLHADDLTGLYNREAFEKLVNYRIDQVQSGEASSTFAVMFLDINSFKHINDTLGHQVGDDIIRFLGAHVQLIVEDTDIAARYAGDEFVMLIDKPIGKPHRISDVIEALKGIGDQDAVIASNGMGVIDPSVIMKVNFKVAIGVAHFPEDGHSASALVSVADENMYLDKGKKAKR